MSNLSEKQRAWLKKLGAVVNSGDGGGTEVAAPAEPHLVTISATIDRKTQPVGPTVKKGATAAPVGEKAASFGARGEQVGGILPIPLPDAGNRTCICMIINNTDQTLILDPVSASEVSDENAIGLSHGEYKSKPPPRINPQQKDAKFRAVNKSVPILDIHTAGVEGRVRYFLDDQKKAFWKLHFDNPALKTDGNSGDAELGGSKDIIAKFDAPDPDFDEGNEVTFTFILNQAGGPAPKPGPQPPGPQPGPGPGQDVKSSCNITVTNNTKLVLTLADQGHDRGDFINFPPPTIQPGASAQFVSVETPHGKEQGCKGFVSWEVGSPSAAIWRCEWDNPEGDKNTAKAPAEPQSAGFRTLAQIGQDDENVPVVFTISGGGAGPAPQPTPNPTPGPAPGPQPGPAPGPEPPPEPFNAPPGSRQPTLRKGDKSPDGWVEFLQVQLNHHLNLNLKVDGNFGQQTLNAVLAFQKKFGLQVDGTVGNQTWAALREDKPEAPSTDGRKPHTFEEKGTQARFDNENVDGVYSVSQDLLQIFVASVGEEPIDKFHMHVRVTPPDGKSFVKQFVIGPPVENQGVKNQPGGGAQHKVRIENFKKQFPAKDPNAKVSDYKFEAFFDQELGPDVFRGKINEIA